MTGVLIKKNIRTQLGKEDTLYKVKKKNTQLQAEEKGFRIKLILQLHHLQNQYKINFCCLTQEWNTAGALSPITAHRARYK
jgi:hypothetical protein